MKVSVGAAQTQRAGSIPVQGSDAGRSRRRPSPNRPAVIASRVANSVAVARVTRRIAKAMLGKEVSVRVVNTEETVHGVVTSVLADGDNPRVVVGGSEYELSQVLTVSPPAPSECRPEA